MDDVTKKSPTPKERIERMQKSFDEDYSVLAEDYDFFSKGAFTSDASTSLSTTPRTSAERSARKSRARS